MNQKEVLITEYNNLRKEILARLQIHHYIVLSASIILVILLIIGIFLNRNNFLDTYLLIIPLIFAGIIFNYQSNQRVMEATARYIEEKIRPKMEGEIKDSAFEWEKYFAGEKRRWQFSSIYTLFSMLAPFFIPILLLIFANLSRFQLILALVDLFFLLVIIANFRYKLFRIK
jgi:hypothetical protein